MRHPALLDSHAGLGDDPDIGPYFFQHPRYRFPVDISRDVPRLIEPPAADWTAPLALFPKLGAKSWRDRGDLATIGVHQPVRPAIEAMLARLSPRQHRYLSLVRKSIDRVDLSLYAYVDFADISEARWQVTQGKPRLTSQCLRGASAAPAREAHDAMRALAASVGSALSVDAMLDIAVRPCGAVAILEINPSAAQTANSCA